jgi:hypothetical protein
LVIVEAYPPRSLERNAAIGMRQHQYCARIPQVLRDAIESMTSFVVTRALA